MACRRALFVFARIKGVEIMQTPAQTHKRNAKPVSFKSLNIGETFECSGNLWTKRSTRTAAGIWPACLPKWAYFGGNEVVYH